MSQLLSPSQCLAALPIPMRHYVTFLSSHPGVPASCIPEVLLSMLMLPVLAGFAPSCPPKAHSKAVHCVLQGQGQQSIAAELAFQQHLAKQLGLKGKNKTKAKGPDDGLDDLLQGAV